MDQIEFFYLKYFYDKHTLTPRLDTESLVRKSIEISRKSKIDTLIDIGTGTGIIGISIEKNTGIRNIYGIEKSQMAARVAEMNIKKLSSRMQLLKGDLLKPFLNNKNDFPELGNVMIATNLPYIKNEDWGNMSEDTRFEPKMALFGGAKTGFELYEKLFRQIKSFTEEYDVPELHVVAEIGFDQKEVSEVLLKREGFIPTYFSDLSGIERFIYINMKHGI